MLKWLTHLDRLLRGEVTRREEISDGQIKIDAAGIAVLIVVLGMIYGLCMGSFSLMKDVPDALKDSNGRYLQWFATVVKVPALFYLALIVTFPSLYVFNALVGSRLTLVSVLRLLVASLAVNLAVLASLGPIVMFFSLTTQSYAFIQLLNVAAFTVAGILGLAFLLQTLHRLTSPQVSSPAIPVTPIETKLPGEQPSDATVDVRDRVFAEQPSPLEMVEGETLGRHTRLVFGCWVVVFAVVGAQMGWVLRPFIGSPTQPFEWFRVRQSNFFEAVLHALGSLLGGV
jgi:hypothetical protein